MTFRQEGDGMLAIQMFASRTKVGVLDGVDVNLDHPGLGADWVPTTSRQARDDGLSEGILFPSEQRMPLEEFRRQKKLPDTFFLVHANPGDRLTITSVVPDITGKSYDHRQDRESRLAYLTLVRSSGETIQLPTPMRFVCSARLKMGNAVFAFENVIDRIQRYSNASEPDQASATIREEALSAARSAEMLFDSARTHAADVMAEMELTLLVNLAAQAGYHLGRLETLDLEARRDKQIENARLTSQSRTSPAQLAAAKKMASDNPQWRRSKLARELAPIWGRDPRSIQDTLNRRGIGPEPEKR